MIKPRKIPAAANVSVAFTSSFSMNAYLVTDNKKSKHMKIPFKISKKTEQGFNWMQNEEFSGIYGEKVT